MSFCCGKGSRSFRPSSRHAPHAVRPVKNTSTGAGGRHAERACYFPQQKLMTRLPTMRRWCPVERTMAPDRPPKLLLPLRRLAMHEALQTIQSFVAPVVMISANGLLCLAFYNRMAAVIHRTREINRERFESGLAADLDSRTGARTARRPLTWPTGSRSSMNWGTNSSGACG